jgi:hypothetical protein
MHDTTVGELGVHSKNLISYLSAIPGTPAIKDNANPATYMLEVIGAGTTARINSQVTTHNIYIDKRTTVRCCALDTKNTFKTPHNIAQSM